MGKYKISNNRRKTLIKKEKKQTFSDQNNIAENMINQTNAAFGDKIGLFGKLFGCRHKRISRPFKNYLTCLTCGARQPFDAQNLKTNGSFYYPPTISHR